MPTAKLAPNKATGYTRRSFEPASSWPESTGSRLIVSVLVILGCWLAVALIGMCGDWLREAMHTVQAASVRGVA